MLIATAILPILIAILPSQHLSCSKTLHSRINLRALKLSVLGMLRISGLRPPQNIMQETDKAGIMTGRGTVVDMVTRLNAHKVKLQLVFVELGITQIAAISHVVEMPGMP
jgi:hypothetical protein